MCWILAIRHAKKPKTQTLWIICQNYMTQIWHECACLSVCLLKPSQLYPSCVQNCASHMDTTMLRISPCFLTKPSEQPAKNNKTCCLCSRPHPHGEDITGGEEPVLLWPPQLKLIQNTDQTLGCKLKLCKESGGKERSWGGEFIFLDIVPRYTLAQGWTEGFSSYFLTQNMSPTQSSGGFILQQAPSRSPGMSPELLQ